MAARRRVAFDAAFGGDGEAVLAAAFEELFDAELLLRRDQRPHIEIVFGGADAQGAIAFGETFEKLVVDLALNDETRGGGAGLARVLDSGVHEERQRALDIGIFEHDLRRFSAELERDGHGIASGSRLHQRADGRRTR